MKLESYQVEAAQWLSTRRRGLVIAVAGSGKTLIAAAAIDLVLSRRDTLKPWAIIGWMCNTQEQKQQAMAALEHYKIPSRCAIRVSCDNSSVRQDWSRCGLLVVDEAHHSGSESWSAQISTCRGALWGLTATPETGDRDRDAALFELFETHIRIGRERVGARLVKAKVIMLTASDPCGDAIDAEIKRMIPIRRRQMPYAADGEIYRMVSWQACMDIGIVANAARNAAFLTAVRQHTCDKVLVLVNRVEHAQWFADELGKLVQCVHSKMPKRTRASAMASFREGAVWCLVATSLADEGLDLPMANVMALVSGGRSRLKAEQRTGRVLRAFAGKSQGLIYDSLDLQHKTMKKHAEARMGLYRDLGYEVDEPQRTL